MKLRQLAYGIVAWLVVMIIGVLLMVSGDSERKAERALQVAVGDRFPDDIPDCYYITDDEISTIVALGEVEDDQVLLEFWERLIIDEQKRFNEFRIYELDNKPIYVYIALSDLVERRPEFVDRIVRTFSIVYSRAHYRYVESGIDSTVLPYILQSPYIEKVSFESLQELFESIPDAQDYILSLYRIYNNFFYEIISQEKIYNLYQSINDENYIELLNESVFMEQGLLPNLDDERIGIRNYYHVRALIKERLAVMNADDG